MSEHLSVDGSRVAARFVVAMLASLVCVFGAAWPQTVAVQQRATVPDFTIDNKSAWLNEVAPLPQAAKPDF